MIIPIQKIFPTIMIVLSACSSIVFASKGFSEWRMALYWAAAAVLSYTITW